jgi:hypothetical protein
MMEIGYRAKTGTGLRGLGFKIVCVISARHNDQSKVITKQMLKQACRVRANTRRESCWDKQLSRSSAMECQRCLTGKEAKYRVYTDIIDMKVCEVCADEARKLGIAVEVLDDGEEKARIRQGKGILRCSLVHL